MILNPYDIDDAKEILRLADQGFVNTMDEDGDDYSLWIQAVQTVALEKKPDAYDHSFEAECKRFHGSEDY